MIASKRIEKLLKEIQLASSRLPQFDGLGINEQDLLRHFQNGELATSPDGVLRKMAQRKWTEIQDLYQNQGENFLKGIYEMDTCKTLSVVLKISGGGKIELSGHDTGFWFLPLEVSDGKPDPSKVYLPQLAALLLATLPEDFIFYSLLSKDALFRSILTGNGN